MQLVDGAECAVHGRFIDIMAENDAAVVGIVHDVGVDGVGVAVFPVLRIDRPVNERRVDDGFDGLVRISIGCADIVGLIATRLDQQVARGIDLVAYLLGSQRIEIFVVVRVIGKLVTARDDGVKDAGVGGNAAAGDEKGRLDAALLQRGEKVKRIVARAVVKRNGHQLCAAVLFVFRRKGRERQRKRKNGTERQTK